ncbi:MAG: GH92 family glycosyl hydrolase [Lachnospiraceae bacterium]|nr:GH92 family glycosyl hydrolase [Lachnospiraceae bacterium]
MNYLQYVNIKQGSQSTNRFSQGNTLPLVQRPFGFASFAPQTDASRGGWFYHPQDRCFEGFRLTHQPSCWIGEHGALVMLPQTTTAFGRFFRAWSSFDPKKTVLMPHYMKYYMNRCYADFELTPTEYGACIRLAFHRDFDKFLSFMAVHGAEYTYEYDTENHRLFVKTDCDTMQSYDPGKLYSYFVIQFETDAVDVDGILTDDEEGQKKGLSVSGKGASMHIALKKSSIECRMATSFISYEQALLNLEHDSVYDSFYALRDENEKIWNQWLSRVEVTADEDKMKAFYSCMYRAGLFPHKAYEVNAQGEPVHYAPSADAVLPGYRYTDNGFWDTYRTVYPFFSIVAPEECREMLDGFIQDYRDGGWLPCWTAGTAKNCMPSTGIDAVIADLAAKGILSGKLLREGFAGMEKHANTASDRPAYGRDGCAEYLKRGYVPMQYKESVNLTLDAAYFDYCLAQVAEILGDEQKKEKYLARSKNYRNIFDPETGFMRAKDEDGNMKPGFTPISWGGDYTEAAAWQTTFAVQHDIEGLAELMGGKEALIAKLDEFFAAPAEFEVGGYGREIHEMSEMAACDWGQCAISNQPSFHIPFMYAYLGERQKADYWLEKICREGFSGEDDGFPGDEDNGTTAIWYLFASLGLYPVCPGKAEYTVTAPMVENIRILGKPLGHLGDRTMISHAELKSVLGI